MILDFFTGARVIGCTTVARLQCQQTACPFCSEVLLAADTGLEAACVMNTGFEVEDQVEVAHQ